MEDQHPGTGHPVFSVLCFSGIEKSRLGHRVIDMMDEWQSFLDEGFTTFPEHGIESQVGLPCLVGASHV